MLDFAIPAVLAALLLVLERAHRAKWRRWIGAEGPRFVLRVHAVSADGTPVRIGTSVEDVASAAPDLEAVEAVLEDDAEHRIRLPAGLRLRARAFDGATRQPLEPVTSASGMRQRFSFDVPPATDFWILDAPGIHAGPDVLPAHAEGWEITTRTQPIPADLERHADPKWWPLALLAIAVVGVTALEMGVVGEWATAVWLGGVGIAGLRAFALVRALVRAPVSPAAARAPEDEDRLSVTIAHMEAPLFTYRLGDAEEWLCPPKKPDGPRVLFLDATDPHATSQDDPRDDLVTSAASVLAEAVWLETDARAVVGAPIVIGRVRVQQTGAMKAYEDFASFVSKFEGRHLVVWGEARADPSRDGFLLRMRASEEPGTAEETIEGPLPELGARLVDWMVRRGWCRRATPPAGFGAPVGEVLDGYQRVLSGLVLLSLVHPRNRALPNPSPGFPASVAALAESVAQAAPDLARARLAWWVATIYAHELGGLPAEAKERVHEDARAATQGDPLFGITPRVMWRLGFSDEARKRRDALLASAAAPYREGGGGTFREWLAKMEED